MTPRDSFRPYENDQVAPGASYVFHQPLSTSWKQSLLVLPILALGTGMVLWLNHQTTRQQARIEVSEVVKAVGVPAGQAGLRPLEPIVPDAVGTSGTTAVGTAGRLASRPERSLPGGAIVATLPGSAEDRLSAFLASSKSGGTSIVIDRLTFKRGSTRLTAASLEQIGNIATILRAYPAARVTVAGYTDDAGIAPASERIARARAKAVADRLRQDGVAAGRVLLREPGGEHTTADNSTAAGQLPNRGIVLEVNASR